MQNPNNRSAGGIIYDTQPRPQDLCGRGEETDDPGKGCPNLLVHWLTHSTSQDL